MKRILKIKLKVSKMKKKRIDLLISKYFKDNSTSSDKWAIKSCKESLWELVHNLITIFRIKNPLSHPLF